MMSNALMEEPVIRIDSEVTRRVRQHARAHMQTEVCGVLVGKMSQGILEIEAPIEAFTATQAGAHVTFTQAAWETIYKVKDREYPEDRIVGWYHSHPGFGVFLSDYDTFIHRNFFSSPDQVAWVYDPHSDEEGCFGWIDGSIHRIAHIHVADSSGDGLQRAGTRDSSAAEELGAQRRRMPMEAAPTLTAQSRRTGPGPTGPGRKDPGRTTLGGTARLAAAQRGATAAWLHLTWLLIVTIVPASRRLFRTQGSVPGRETPPSTGSRPGSDATEPLRPESNQ